jgi:hypothetical protein
VSIARSRRSRALLDRFESDLQLHVAERAPRHVFVHAGVVGWRGRAILLPGRSGAGKTMLVAELIRAGATYYSDEYAILDGRGRVRPFARPLAVRAEGSVRRRRPPGAFGARTGTRALPVALVVVSRYRPGARWRLRRLSPGEGALALMAHTVPARRDPARVLAALQAVAVRAPVFRGVRGEAREAARALLVRLDALTRPESPGEASSARG